MKAQSFVLFTGFMVVLGTVVPAFSQSWPAGVTPVRGVVESISGDTLTVKSQTGLVRIHTESPLQIYRDTPSDLAHVNRASFVGVTSIKQPDGSESAKEVHIFPEELRGTGEGSYLLDQDQSKPTSNSRMTNGAVSQSRMTNGAVSRSRMTNGTVNARSDASTLTIQYSGGVQTIPASIACFAAVPNSATVRRASFLLIGRGTTVGFCPEGVTPLKENFLDKVLAFDDEIAKYLYSPGRLLPTYSKSQITDLRNNYNGATPDPGYIPNWKLMLKGLASGTAEALSIQDLQDRFVVHEQITRLVCVEGWSGIGCPCCGRRPSPTSSTYGRR
jgi:hypothetical protein